MRLLFGGSTVMPHEELDRHNNNYWRAESQSGQPTKSVFPHIIIPLWEYSINVFQIQAIITFLEILYLSLYDFYSPFEAISHIQYVG